MAQMTNVMGLVTVGGAVGLVLLYAKIANQWPSDWTDWLAGALLCIPVQMTLWEACSRGGYRIRSWFNPALRPPALRETVMARLTEVQQAISTGEWEEVMIMPDAWAQIEALPEPVRSALCAAWIPADAPMRLRGWIGHAELTVTAAARRLQETPLTVTIDLDYETEPFFRIASVKVTVPPGSE